VTYQAFNEDYVKRLIAGDADTERHFVSYFSELLLIKLRRALRTHQAIDDVRQETFLRVFRVLRRKELSSPESLGAFVNGVCNNVLAEFYRSVSRLTPLPANGPESPGADPDPEKEFETEERKRHVHRVLEALPAKDRKILRLIFFEEQDKDEVCRICRVDRSYLRVLLHRAKNRFRKQSPEAAPAANRAAFV
jgi:RNA polymerase sigma-70 factor (ECF subfamily)